MPNAPTTSWSDFWRERRIGPQLELARRRGRARDATFDQLLDVIPRALEDVDRPALLHGDLWSGNVLADGGGRPVLLEAGVSAPDWGRDDKSLQQLLTKAERGGLGQSLMLWMIDAALEQQEALIAQGHNIDIAIRMAGSWASRST